MKRLNPKTNKPFKCRDIREDGFLFLNYELTILKKDGFFKEKWRSPETFEKQKAQIRKASNIWKKENREKQNASHSKYKKNNRGKDAANVAKRRASKLKRTPPWLTKNQLLQIQKFYILAKQKTKQTGVKYHVDHIVPLQGKDVSGLHVPWNLQIIPAIQNMQKGNRSSLLF